MKTFQLRFNLSKGKNFRKWKLTAPDGTVQYLEPNLFSFEITNGWFHNNKKTAQEIFDGADKSVCAWVRAENITVLPVEERLARVDHGMEWVSYNPRKCVHWSRDGQDLDGSRFTKAVAVSGRVYS